MKSTQKPKKSSQHQASKDNSDNSSPEVSKELSISRFTKAEWQEMTNYSNYSDDPSETITNLNIPDKQLGEQFSPNSIPEESLNNPSSAKAIADSCYSEQPKTEEPHCSSLNSSNRGDQSNASLSNQTETAAIAKTYIPPQPKPFATNSIHSHHQSQLTGLTETPIETAKLVECSNHSVDIPEKKTKTANYETAQEPSLQHSPMSKTSDTNYHSNYQSDKPYHRFVIDRMIRLGLQYGAIILLALGFGAIGYIIGQPDKNTLTTTKVLELTFPNETNMENSNSALIVDEYKRNDQIEIPTEDQVDNDFPSPFSTALAHSELSHKAPITIDLQSDLIRSDSQPISPETINSWQAFFKPMAKHQTDLKSTTVFKKEYADQTNDLQFPEEITVNSINSATISDSQNLPKSISAPINDQPSESQPFTKTVEEQEQESRYVMNTVSTEETDRSFQHILELEEHLFSLNERMLAVERELMFLNSGRNTNHPRENTHILPLDDGVSIQQVSPKPDMVQQKSKNSLESYSILSDTELNTHATLRSAKVGDYIDGYGTVQKITVYDHGGRMLFLDKGAVYLK